MSRVAYGQKGYSGASMSVNARAAYEAGEMPRSKWTKTAILGALRGYCDEMSVPADYADSSHVVPSVFISGTGGDRAWRDIDFDEAERKFAAAARRAAAFREGRPKLMQDEARRAAIRETRHRVFTASILKSIKEIHR